MGGVDAAVTNKARVVSMSWGGDEFAAEANYDSHFHKPGVSFLASSGDNGNGVSYPASSPYVLSVGGTTLALDAAGALTKTEKGWQGSGGGISAYEKQPSYQSALSLATGGMRATPDISADGDPQTGVAVYHAGSGGGWYTVGGTSASAPQWAGVVAVADSLRPIPLATSAKDRSFVYGAAVTSGNFRDIKSGKNGTCGAHCRAAAGFDLVTGLGSPLLSSLIPVLASQK